MVVTFKLAEEEEDKELLECGVIELFGVVETVDMLLLLFNIGIGVTFVMLLLFKGVVLKLGTLVIDEALTKSVLSRSSFFPLAFVLTVVLFA